MRIFLIGFMGCGKTTLGKKLASRLGYPFIDLDHQLERDAGLSITEYFAAHGEEAFRKFENQVLKHTPYAEDCVIATGGGAPCYYDNMEVMNSMGQTVYIEMPAWALAKRLEHGKHKRPLLKDMNEEELIAFISAKLLEREPYYKQAKYIVTGIDLNAERLHAALSEQQKP
jgi:shikimate kinase